ncbi:MAG: zinc-ribbon domain-containing protein [Pseudogulbenkiania sp.]|nr:zinc-ribbon domain-containing protein [Pseudogulbenkiania sp.]
MTHTTQCPGCQTRFKVSDAQLSVANGLVRCGRCAHVFNATEHMIGAEPPLLTPAPMPPRPAASATVASERDPADDFELELPDFDPLVSAPPREPSLAETPSAPSAVPADEAVSAASAADDMATFQRALSEAMQHRDATAPIGDPFAPVPASADPRQSLQEETPPVHSAPSPRAPRNEPEQNEERGQPKGATVMVMPEAEPAEAAFDPGADLPGLDERSKRSRRPLNWLAWLMAGLSVIGVLALALQLVYLNRTRIAAEVPELRPTLEKLCQGAGCTVPLPTDSALIRTEWSELSFVPDQQNLIQLAATLKNHAAYPQAYPMLEVTLKDAEDQVVIRKVFAPQEYLKPDDYKAMQFKGNSEIRIAMRFDVGKVRAMGYSLLWFYP